MRVNLYKLHFPYSQYPLPISLVFLLLSLREIQKWSSKFWGEKNESLTSFGHPLAFAKPTIDAFGSNFFFPHTCRLGNFVTHNLTKYARHVSGFLV